MENEISEFLNSGTRIWTVSSETLRNMRIDFGAVVNCTQEKDVIRIRSNDVIRPAKTVVISWNLTLTASSDEDTELEDGVSPRAAKATFRCPKKQGIFFIRRVLAAHALS